MTEKYELQTVTDKPYNAETPLKALIGGKTPTGLFYIRNHFEVPSLNADRFNLSINGEITQPIEFSLDQLKIFPEKSITVVMECAGNGRSSMKPQINGTAWNMGAISQAEFTGTPLHNILDKSLLSEQVQEIRFTGADRGKIHSGETENYIRSLPVEIANHPDTMVVWKMNGQDLPPQHGYPLRLIVPGWYGMASVKWLYEITAMSQPFNGFFQSQEYVYIGEEGIPDHTPVTNMRVRSIFTEPDDGAKISGDNIHITGIAWSGEGNVQKVELSFDGGDNWLPSNLHPSPTTYGVTRWEFDWHPARTGRHSIIARATDSFGNTQPVQPVWNKGGYGNNGVHQIQISVY